MREIKFRAWDKVLKQWKEIYSLPLPNSTDGQGRMVAYSQFTGLHDKNGNPVYEGDILKAVGGEDEEKGLMCVVEWDDDYSRFCLVDNKEEGDYIFSSHNRNFWEKIGNIYEHPSLITNPEKK